MITSGRLESDYAETPDGSAQIMPDVCKEILGIDCWRSLGTRISLKELFKWKLRD
jgi:hypothetical protein